MNKVHPLPGDYICIVSVVLLGVALLIFGQFLHPIREQTRLYVQISVNGTTEITCPLDSDFTYETTSGVIIKIENGKASVTHSDCPDGLCMNCRAISSPGSMIVCLPRKTTLKVIGTQQEVDAIV